MMERPYLVVKSEKHKVGRFEIMKDVIEIDGKEYPYSYVIERDCVVILPILKGNVVIINQYRHSINRWRLELPGGSIDEGETHEAAAIRELKEETGCIADKMYFLGEYVTSAGTSSGRAFLYLADCKEKTEKAIEATEMIETQTYSVEVFEDMVKNGEFAHVLGLVSWYRAKEQYRGQVF